MSVFRRVVALSAAIAVVTIGLVAVPAVTDTPVQPADAAPAICYNPVDSRYKNLHTAATIGEVTAGATETGVGAYVEGNFSALNGAQETEGQFVVGGDANYFTHTYSNIGTVGIGSGVSPVSGSDVLVTGGDINIGTGTPAVTQVEVSHWSEGNIVAGGTVAVGAGDSLSFNGAGGSSTGAATPLAPYSAFPTFFNYLSTFYAAQATTGTVTTNATDVTFAGNGTSDPQIFTIASGSTLGTLATPKKFSFTGIPINAVVIVNVTAASVTVSTNQLVALNGTDVDWSVPYTTDPTFSHFTQSLFWNLPNATTATFGNGSQIPGSIDAPNADVVLLASTNGRVYAGGDVELGDLAGTQSGLEMHNYAFRAYDCSTSDGELSITKTLTDSFGVVESTREFTGTYECHDGATLGPSGTWSFTIGDAPVVITGIPDGYVCTVAEDAPDAPTAADASYSWSTPTVTPSSVTIADGVTSGLVVHNTVQRNSGSIAITKSLTAPVGLVSPGRAFGGTYTCTLSGGGAGPTGMWSVAAGSTQTIAGLPTGATCVFDEDLSTAPSASDTSYVWAAPVWTPDDEVTVGNGTTVSLGVANSVTQEVGELAITKTLLDVETVVIGGRIFSGTYSCSFGATVVASGTWSVAAAGTDTITGLPAGSSCTLTENLSVAPSASDSSYVWRAVVFSPTTASITDGGTATIGVQNEVRHRLGDFEMRKVLDDPFGLTSLTRDYTGTFECIHNTVDVTPSPNTWTAKAGDPAQTLATDLPFGTVCTIDEDPLTDLPVPGRPQFQWADPTYSVASVTIGDGTTVRITVTNTVFDPFELPHAGEDVSAFLSVGGGALGIGAILIAFGYRRRVARDRRTA